MKKVLALVVLSSCILFASDDADADKRLKKQIQKEMENENKYATEQRFYTEEDYDFKGSEVNKESLKYIDIIESDDLMESSDFMDMPN